MKRRGLFLVANVCLALILLLLNLNCAPKPAGLAPEDFFKTKAIDFTSPGEAGGALDRATRVLMPVITKHLGTTGVVTGRTGAGGIEGFNHVWISEPDGTHISLWEVWSLVANPIFEPATSTYEPDKFGYIVGFPEMDRYMFFVSKDSPYTSIDGLKAAKNLQLGGTTPAGTYTLGTMSVASLLDLDAKVLSGIRGAAGLALKLMQKEIAGAVMAAGQGPLNADKVKPLFALGTKRSSLYPNVPALGELTTFNDSTKKVLLAMGDTFFSPLRSVFTSRPNVPKDRLEYLRKVLGQKVIPEARTELENAFGGAQAGAVMKLEDFIPGEDVAKLVGAQWAKKDDIKRLFQSLIDKYRM